MLGKITCWVENGEGGGARRIVVPMPGMMAGSPVMVAMLIMSVAVIRVIMQMVEYGVWR